MLSYTLKKIRVFSSFCFKAISTLFPHLLHSSNEVNFASLEEEYTPKYCLQLEAAYGEGMMSEGGSKGIEHMFDQIPLEGKKALDIGSGLGGVPFYLAEKYSMQLTGLEVNSWMVMESQKRTPDHLKGKVNFLLNLSNTQWPIPSDSYDIIYSKGVLTHIESKDSLLQECYRLLKKGGILVITDWLSSEEKKWGENIAKLVELENLALFPESESGYIEILKKNGFTILSVRDDSQTYIQYNQEIVERLQKPTQQQLALNLFDDGERDASISGYQSIIRALKLGELRVLRFVMQKD